jgi:hypothetical protein
MIIIENFVDYFISIIYQNLRINQFLRMIGFQPDRLAVMTKPPIPLSTKGACGVITFLQP